MVAAAQGAATVTDGTAADSGRGGRHAVSAPGAGCYPPASPSLEKPVKIELSRRIRRDIDAVRAAVADADVLAAWQPTLKSVRVLSGRRGEAGSVCELVYDENGREVRLEETVTDTRDPELLELTCRGEQAVSRIRHWFASPAEGETVWTVDCHFRFLGLGPRLLAPFVKGSVRRRIDGDMARLQQLLEQEEQSR